MIYCTLDPDPGSQVIPDPDPTPRLGQLKKEINYMCIIENVPTGLQQDFNNFY